MDSSQELLLDTGFTSACRVGLQTLNERAAALKTVALLGTAMGEDGLRVLGPPEMAPSPCDK